MGSVISPSSDLLYFDFNQDYSISSRLFYLNSCIAVGTKNGYKIFNCDPFGKCYEKNNGGIGIVSMLFCTSLIALVGSGDQPSQSPRKLSIVNTKRDSIICELNFPSKILAAKLNRKRLIVVLEDKVQIYDITNLKLLHTIDTPPNPKGIAALSPNSENSLLACLSQQSNGDLLIFDALNLQPISVMSAHKSPISIIVFNENGDLIATASDKGTVIRVFSLPDCQCKYQFRRGSFPSSIYSLAFNATSTFLCVSSASDTVHIFKLDSTTQIKDFKSGSGGTSAIGGGLGSYLPGVINEMLEPTRDFGHLKLSQKMSNICAINSRLSQVIIATASGHLFEYAIDLERGGECTLLRQHSFIVPDNLSMLFPSAEDMMKLMSSFIPIIYA